MTEAKSSSAAAAVSATAAKKPTRKAAAKKPAAKKPAAKKTAPKKASAKPATKAPARLDLPRNPLMFEILDLASRQRTKAKKVEVLRKYGDLALKSILIWNYDESVKSALPPGEVPYSGYDEQTVYNGTLTSRLENSARAMYEANSFSLGNVDANARTTIRAQSKNLYHFVVGGNGGLAQTRREMMFINLLESVHPLEAHILVLVKDKNLESAYKIPFDVVKEAFPDIRWGGRG